MQIISIPALCMAAVTWYVGLYHLFLYPRLRQREDLSFAVLCLAMTFYNILCAGLYNARTVADGFVWQRGQVAVLSLVGAAYVWFATDYVQFASRKIRNALALFLSVSAVLVYFVQSPFFWHPDRIAEKQLHLPAGLEIHYHEVAPGFFSDCLGAVGFLVYGYVIFLAVWLARKDKTRSKALFFSATIFCAGLINDILVHTQVYRSIYLVEYTYMAVVVLMANRLSKSVLESARLKEAYEASEKKYRSLVDHSLVGIFIVKNGVIHFCNQPFATLFGYAKTDHVLGKSSREFLPAEWTAAEGQEGVVLPKEGFARRETRVKTLFGKQMDLEWLITPFFIEGERAWHGSVIDITARKKAEDELQKSLEEKNILLKEINHRVKNNLQIIMSLLNLESRRTDNTQVQEVLKDCNQRVLTMAVIHEMLYRSERFEWIDFHEYTVRLATDLIRSFDVEGRISPNLDVQNVFLSLDQAIPCGLILNELITNAIKHAFPGEKKGRIAVRFLQHENGFFELSVSDDGIGIPEKTTAGGGDSLGLRIVDVLAEQLGGKLKKESGKGASYSIVFPVMR